MGWIFEPCNWDSYELVFTQVTPSPPLLFSKWNSQAQQPQAIALAFGPVILDYGLMSELERGSYKCTPHFREAACCLRGRANFPFLLLLSNKEQGYDQCRVAFLSHPRPTCSDKHPVPRSGNGYFPLSIFPQPHSPFPKARDEQQTKILHLNTECGWHIYSTPLWNDKKQWYQLGWLCTGDCKIPFLPTAELEHFTMGDLKLVRKPKAKGSKSQTVETRPWCYMLSTWLGHLTFWSNSLFSNVFITWQGLFH